MTLQKRTLTLLIALGVVSTGLISTPAAADLEVVAVMALHTRLTDDVAVFELNADKQAIASGFSFELTQTLNDRLAAEFETAQRSAELASAFSEQILDALDERLPNEVGDLIAEAN